MVRPVGSSSPTPFACQYLENAELQRKVKELEARLAELEPAEEVEDVAA